MKLHGWIKGCHYFYCEYLVMMVSTQYHFFWMSYSFTLMNINDFEITLNFWYYNYSQALWLLCCCRFSQYLQFPQETSTWFRQVGFIVVLMHNILYGVFANMGLRYCKCYLMVAYSLFVQNTVARNCELKTMHVNIM